MLAGLVAAASDPVPLADPIGLARAVLEKEMPKVPGATVAVAIDGQIIWSEAFGFADLEAKRPAATTTRFRIGSVSKPVTAAGLMLLVERGALDLDAPVQKYVPDFPVKAEGRITTRQLGGHLAGIRHYQGTETGLNRPFANVRAGLSIFENDPLVAPPGTKFFYTTYGWSLISAVMESAATRDFLSYMEAEVFQPLNMAHTRPDRAGATDPDRTHFYEMGPGGVFLAAQPMDPSYKWAGGGFLSTAEDLAHFGSALLQPGFLKPESLALLFTSQKTVEGKPTGYGIGWSIGRTKSYPIYVHTGGQQGCSAVLFIRPDAKVVVVILANIANSAIIAQAKTVAELFAPSVKPAVKTK